MASKTILVGFDGSESAQRAITQACQLATKMDAGVLLAYSARLDMSPYDFPISSAGDLNALIRYGERILAEAKGKLAGSPFPVVTEVLSGSPGESLAKRAEAPDIYWVVVGRSGRGAVSRFLMGSVASRLAHICEKPLVIVP